MNVYGRIVNIDDMLSYLSNKGVDVDDNYYIGNKYTLRELFDLYYKERSSAPEVKIGQTIWVIKTEYRLEQKDFEYKIIECEVRSIMLRERYSFSVTNKRGVNWYSATFTKNSIGKTVFLTQEGAEKFINDKQKVEGK